MRAPRMNQSDSPNTLHRKTHVAKKNGGGLKEKWRRVRGSERGGQSRKELETAACLPAHGKEIRFGRTLHAAISAPCTQLHPFISSVIDGAFCHPLSLEKQGQEGEAAERMNESLLSEWSVICHWHFQGKGVKFRLTQSGARLIEAEMSGGYA